MKLYIVEHHRDNRWRKDEIEYRLYTSLRAAKSAATLAMKPDSHRGGHTSGAVLYELDLEDLNEIERRGTLFEHVDGQEKLF